MLVLYSVLIFKVSCFIKLVNNFLSRQEVKLMYTVDCQQSILEMCTQIHSTTTETDTILKNVRYVLHTEIKYFCLYFTKYTTPHQQMTCRKLYISLTLIFCVTYQLFCTISHSQET